MRDWYEIVGVKQEVDSRDEVMHTKRYTQSFIHQKMVETQNTTMLNKEIKYNSSPTLTSLFTKQSTPLYRVNCPTFG